MFRKIALAMAAIAVIGAGALTSTDASARGGHGGRGGHGFHGGGHHGGFGRGGFNRGGFHHGGFRHGGWRGGYRYGGPRFFVGGPAYYSYAGCYVRRVVRTPWGPRVRLINRCY